MSRLRRTDEGGVVVPSRLMLVAIVVVAIGAVMYVATSPGKDEAAANPTSSTSAAKTQKSRTPAPTPAATSSSASTSATAKASPSAKPTPKVDRADTYVAVYNNSGRSGLAAKTASKVGGVGWKVVGTDNWYGTIPSTTVYYPAKMKPAAELLAKDLGVRRVMPSVSPMRNDRLTLILTTDYAG